MTGFAPESDRKEITAKMGVSAAALRAEPSPAELGPGAALGQAMFCLPHQLSDDRLVSALPFLFWLLETLRPDVIVQSTVGEGTVYLGLCQLAGTLGLQMRAVGLERPQAPVSAALRARHDADYGAFSSLRSAKTTSLPALAAEIGAEAGAGIDLLILSGGLDSAAAQLLQDGLPPISARGAILLCDPDHLFQSSAQRQAFAEVAQRAGLATRFSLGPWVPDGPVFELIAGPEAPASLTAPASQTALARAAGGPLLALAFARLGQALLDHEALGRLGARQAAMQAAEAEAFADLAALQAQLHDRDRLAQDAARSAAEVAALQEALTGMRQAHAARIDDIAVLTGQFEQDLRDLERIRAEEAQERDRLAAKLKALGKERDQLAAKLKALGKERDQLVAKLKAMATSLSWRVTKPLRKVRQVLRR